MDIVSILVSLASGVAGGNAAGAASKDVNLGPLGNSITGLIGGGLGGYALQFLDILQKSSASGEFDVGALVGNVVSSGLGGAILTGIVGYLKNASGK